MAAFLGQTGVSAEFVAEKLQENSESQISFSNSKVSVVGEEGFLSNIFKVEFDWAEKCELPESVLVKIPTTGKFDSAFNTVGLGKAEEQCYKECFTEEMNFKFSAMTHDTEVRAYSFLGPKPPILAPKIYFSQNADMEKEQIGILVMEDLTDRAAMVKLDEGLTLDQVLAVADQLASLHAFSLKRPKGWEREFSSLERLKIGQDIMQNMINVSLSLITKYPERFGKFSSEMQSYFTFIEFLKGSMSHWWLGMPPVFVHGDLWACNLLWVKDASGRPSNELLSIIDFQVGHPGNVTEDIGRLLATSASSELRRNHLDTILRHYHKELCGKLGYEPFSLEQVKRAYKAMQPRVVLGTAMSVQIFTGASTIVGEGESMKVAVEKVLDRAEDCLSDFVKEHPKFCLSWMESFRWYACQTFLWVVMKLV